MHRTRNNQQFLNNTYLITDGVEPAVGLKVAGTHKCTATTSTLQFAVILGKLGLVSEDAEPSAWAKTAFDAATVRNARTECHSWYGGSLCKIKQ